MLDAFKFKTAKEYNELLTDRDNLKTQLQAAETEAANLKNMSVEFTDKINAFAKVEADYKKQIEDLKELHSKEQTNLQAKVEEEKTSTETKAQAIVASMGVSNESQLPKVTNVVVDSNYHAERMAKDKTYFAKNKTEILKVAGINPQIWGNSK